MDIFRDGQKIKKLFNARKTPKHDHDDNDITSGTGHTLDRIVNAKEELRRQWEENQEEFEKRKREHEIKMVEMEKAEVIRREKEIRHNQDKLDEQRRKNRLIQETVIEQIRSLQEKLEEYKVNHKAAEEELEDEIAKKEDILSEVKYSLEKRIKNLHMEDGVEDIPSAPPPSSQRQSIAVYPSLPVAFPRSGGATTSPHMSNSSRSDTPSDCSV